MAHFSKRGGQHLDHSLEQDNPILPPALIHLSRSSYTRRRFITTAMKVGAVVSAVPAAMVGLSDRTAEAAVPCVNAPQSLDGICYVSCIGQCSPYFSSCNTDPGRYTQDTCNCANGGGTGTPAQAVGVCNSTATGTFGYCCCVYC